MTEREHTDLEAPDGTRIRRWERVPTDATEAVLFVHGATYAGRAAFDVAGRSWLRAVAESGRAAYAVDARGYGDSERPPALDTSPEANDPVVRAATAATDAETALADLPDRYEAVHLVGYSWGTITTGLLTAERGADVASLVQLAPVYRPPESHRERFAPGDRPAAYRTVTKADARQRWADQRVGESVPGEAFRAFWETLVASGQGVDDTAVRAPNGTLVDLAAAIDERPYDAGAIDVPTLVVRGALDTASTRSDALALFDAMSVADRTYTEVAAGTHFLQLEAPRRTLHETVRGFHGRV